MVQNAISGKWKFLVEFEDEETGEITGTSGEAEDLEECEAFIEFESDDHASEGWRMVNAEAFQVCARCDGEGRHPAGNGGEMICQACGGNIGPIARTCFTW